jgi:PAS domain S-box-containing protein
LEHQNDEKEKRADELLIANKELEYQNKIKGKKAAELIIANKELAFQNEEKEKRAQELIIANKELLYQKDEKQNRADELGIANIELAHQQTEKQNRADELVIANKELLYQTDEKQNRADELEIADIELNFQNEEKEKRVIENKELEAYNYSLKLASQYSRSLIEASLDPLVTISAEGKITDVNNASIKVTGVEREKLVGTDFSIYFTEPKKAKEGYRQVFENGYVADYPLTIKHINGKLTDVVYNASVYKDDSNKVLGVFAAARDITEQNKQKLKSEIATKNLEDSNDSLKLASQYSIGLIESSRDPMFVISVNGKITDTNQATVNATDVSRNNLIGSDFIKYFTEPEKAKSGYQEVFSKGFVIDYPLTIKDGHLTPVLFNGSVYKDENGNIIGAVVVARDITKQKKAERELLQSLKEVTDYKLALDASTIVDITDKNGKILFVNDNYLKISKFSFDELIGGTHKMVNSSFHPPAFMKNLWDTISKGKVWQNQIKNKNKEGGYYWLNMTIVPFLDEQGIPYQYVAISIDVTNQKVLEKELIEARIFAELATSIAEDAKVIAQTETKKAEEAVNSKQQFLSNMSHEIRTPMNAIIGFTKVVLKTELTAKQKEYLMAIKMSGDALIVLINDILDLAKVDAGKMTFEKTPFKLHLSIKAMLHLFEPKIQEKNLKLVTHYDKNIPEVLVGDPVRLHQIILNLVSNAVKFTNEGKITVSVHLLSEKDDEVKLKFTIDDTGIGIKDSKTSKIFENFQQATSGTSRIFGGTGLGLAIVKQLVEAQNGTIHVESAVGKGSSFSFILHFMKTDKEAVLEPEIAELNTEIKDTKILVVEDMELNQLLMKTLLDDFGFECEIASNGKIAIEKLKKSNYDIILMDLQMPEMNGFEATKYIRQTMKLTLPIIALTADVTTVDVAKCKEVGMDDYISKPVDERLLYSKLIGLIKKPVVIIEHLIEGKKETDTIKYVDLSYLSLLTKSNPKLMTEMIQAYLKQTPTLIKSMIESNNNKDWHLLKATVHKMIPSFSIMGISPDFTEIAKKIQEYADKLELSVELNELVAKLEKVCLQSCAELEHELNNLKK